MAGNVADVTDNNFQAEVIESDVPVLVDFWAPWCGPCRMVGPVVEEIAQERGDDLKVVKLNIDENQQTAVAYNVMSIPTLIVFRHGEVAKTVIGAYPKRRLDAEPEPTARQCNARGAGRGALHSERPSARPAPPRLSARARRC
jgi:thioredoxin 1